MRVATIPCEGTACSERAVVRAIIEAFPAQAFDAPELPDEFVERYYCEACLERANNREHSQVVSVAVLDSPDQSSTSEGS